jgi:hypothetical protein
MPEPKKIYGIADDVLKYVLEANQYFTGQWGPHGELPLRGSDRSILKNMIAADLRAVHYDNGDEFFSEVWLILKNQLATTVWTYRGGSIPAWKSMKRKAVQMAFKKIVTKKPLIVDQAMKQALADL